VSENISPAAPAGAIAWPDTARHAAFDAWLQRIAAPHALRIASLRSASSDASFRRYFRIDAEANGRSFIVMDAPPPQEDVRPFVQVAAIVHAAGLNAPTVLEEDAEHGFLLLSDLGSQLYLPTLQAAVAVGDTARADALMRDAIRALVQWQRRADASALPRYDDALLRRELGLFPDWCVAIECAAVWTADEQQQWREACDLLVASALAQPTVAVHRDYMPRNLMLCGDVGAKPAPGAQALLANPGILDFQDAVLGPISYDVASLLRDAFISWDEEQEIDWAVRYWQAARQAGLPLPDDFGEFWRALEWMGLQRHLKVLGVFCRLKHRDAKPAYSADLPRFFGYAHKVAARYNALRPLSRLLEPLMGAERLEVFG
jgi:aminoglycoside/choline kinase family phosphotransferase